MKRLSEYFQHSAPKRAADPNPQPQGDAASTSATISSNTTEPASTPEGHGSADTDNPPTIASNPEVDIGLNVKKCGLSDRQRLALLDFSWKPPEGFVWPFSEKSENNKLRRKYLGPQHFIGDYKLFSYSLASSGIFCKSCVLFGPKTAGGNLLDQLVRRPLQKYSHLTGRDGYLSSHINTKFHRDSVTRAEFFRSTITGDSGSVADQVDSHSKQQFDKNRAALRRILVAIEYHGRLGLSLRGHRDSGIMTVPSTQEQTGSTSSDIDFSQGNFRSLLQLMMSCNDGVLRDHFLSHGRNAAYISSNSQNELISCISTDFVRHITTEVNSSPFFALLADETRDFSGQEQLTICVRYLTGGLDVKERFLGFRLPVALTGSALVKELLDFLAASGIRTAGMVGQGYDGAAAMSGAISGVQAHVLQSCPLAAYVHCCAHALNLCLVKAAEIQDIRSAVSLMHDIAVFFVDSPKRLQNLQQSILLKCPESSHSRLKKHCATRWVEKQEAVFIFRELYPAVLESLEQISLWSGDVAGKATNFLRSIEGRFLLCVEILCHVLEVTKPLSLRLQQVSQDIHMALSSVNGCMEVLKTYRSNGAIFSGLFKAASDLSGEPIRMPRLTGRQQYRSNFPAENAEEYFRRSVYYPFIDSCISQLHERFKSHSSLVYRLSLLIPHYCVDTPFSRISDIGDFYSSLLPDGDFGFEAEFLRWQAHWKQEEPGNRPQTIVGGLRLSISFGTFPIITILLRIFATLRVSTATGERSFSALKFLKNYLRSTMTENRLNGLAHLYINRDVNLDYDKTIDEFAKRNRRLAFI